MTREISIANAKATLSSLINSVAYGESRIILLSRGKPKAAIVGLEDLKRLESEPSSTLRAQALKKAATLRKQLSRQRLSHVEEDLAAIRASRLR